MKIPDFKIGATGQFPRGQVDATDEGELAMAIGADHNHGIVRVVFGKPIEWIGLDSSHARGLAQMLIEKADELDARQT
jgi:hypothetical protein